MTASIRRTFTTLVFALVVALTMPLTAGATVPSTGGEVTHEEIAPPHDGSAGLGEWTEEHLNQPEGVVDGLTEIEIPVPDDAYGVDLPEVIRPEVDESSDSSAEDVAEPTDSGEQSLESEDLDDVGEARGPIDDEPLGTVPVRGKATHIAAGTMHKLYLDEDGQIWAWGNNGGGQLGNGTTTFSNVPVRVNMDGALAGVDVVAVAAGSAYSMALGADGRVYTWGSNISGALGDGTTTNRTTPVRVGGLLASQRVVQLAAGGESHNPFAVALGENGRVYTWGTGTHGQLGNGTTTASQTTPTIVGGLIAGLRIVDVGAGFVNTAALSSDGRIFTWGYRLDGSMGNGSQTAGSQTTPVAVTMTGALAGARIVQVDMGHYRGLALSDEGQIFGWGRNTSGGLGNGTTTGSLVPVRADMAAFDAIGNRPTQISTAVQASLALGEHGGVAAWGTGSYGVLGNGAEGVSPRAVEVSVEGVMGGANIIQVRTGGLTSMALADDGRVFTWGYARDGTLGDGTNTNVNVPTQAGSLRVATEPADLSVAHGAPGAFTAVSVGVPASVQWELSTDGGESWSAIEGATSTTYTTPPSTVEMGGYQYRAVFTSLSDFPTARGLVLQSRAATLTVDGPPVITVQPPERVRSLVGLDVTLLAEADGADPMTVQWQWSTDGGDTWADVDGATENTHAFVATEDLHGALFRAVFTNPSGTATTNNALLEVVLAAPGAHLVVTPQARHVTHLEPT